MQITIARRLAWLAACVIATIPVCSETMTFARVPPGDALSQNVPPVGEALEFEVISVRRAERPTGPPGNTLRTLPGGRFEVNAVSLQVLIIWAYELRPYADSLEGPRELLKQFFTISAKAPTDVALPDRKGVFRAMTRAMLRDRFKLDVSLKQELREVSVIRRLRVDGFGDGLAPVEGDCEGRQPKATEPAPPTLKCGLSYIDGRLAGIVGDMSELAAFLSSTAQRPFVDGTGLVGKFSVSSTSDPASLMPAVRREAAKYAGQEYEEFNTAMEKQLGLTVKRERMPMKTLVVESFAAPTDN